MLQKYNITSYAIIVALAAVLILPVNAKAGEVGDTLLESLNDESARGNTLLKKKHLKEKEKLMQKLMDSIDPLFVENDSLPAEIEEQQERKIVRWAEKAVEKACGRSDSGFEKHAVKNGVAAPWGGYFKFKGDEFSKANACGPVTPEARDIKDYKILRHINNLETWSLAHYKYKNKGEDINERFDVLSEHVVALLDENATLQAERDNRTAMKIVRVVEGALQGVCQGGAVTSQCKKRYLDSLLDKRLAGDNACRKYKTLSDVPQFKYSGMSLLHSNACEDEATWEETYRNGHTGIPLW